MEITWYRRLPQPDVRALPWDGTSSRLEEMQRLAGKYSDMIVAWEDIDGTHVSIITPGADHHVRRGDYVLFTEDGLYVSRRDVFEKWYVPTRQLEDA